jgi:hypothetical protein
VYDRRPFEWVNGTAQRFAVVNASVETVLMQVSSHVGQLRRAVTLHPESIPRQVAAIRQVLSESQAKIDGAARKLAGQCNAHTGDALGYFNRAAA